MSAGCSPDARSSTLNNWAASIPEQIVKNRAPYFEALDAADDAAKAGRIDVSKMETLLESL